MELVGNLFGLNTQERQRAKREAAIDKLRKGIAELRKEIDELNQERDLTKLELGNLENQAKQCYRTTQDRSAAETIWNQARAEDLRLVLKHNTCKLNAVTTTLKKCINNVENQEAILKMEKHMAMIAEGNEGLHQDDVMSHLRAMDQAHAVSDGANDAMNQNREADTRRMTSGAQGSENGAFNTAMDTVLAERLDHPLAQAPTNEPREVSKGNPVRNASADNG